MKDDFYKKLAESHTTVRQNSLSKEHSEAFLIDLLALMFPHYAECNCKSEEEIEAKAKKLQSQLGEILLPYCPDMPETCCKVSEDFFKNIPDIYELLLSDAKAILVMDPAAKSIDEVITCYPGFFAIAVYRIANWFYKKDIKLLPRIMSEFAHREVGVDIHPGAEIAGSFAIDHGTGTVIGETCVIAEHARIYQGVTLGGLVVEKDLKGTKRHPTVEANVTIYAGATILGGETVIGKNTVIGGNVWLIKSVPADSKVYYNAEIKIV